MDEQLYETKLEKVIISISVNEGYTLLYIAHVRLMINTVASRCSLHCDGR